jgi:pimeloyl-ACP methyl ester carboxylesterase
MREFFFYTQQDLKVSGKIFDFPKNKIIEHDFARNILLIHAFPFDSNMFLENFKDRFLINEINNLANNKGKISIFLPDLPGFGKSDRFKTIPSDLTPYVEVMHEIVNHFEIKNIIMGGCSMGGYITLEYATKYANTLNGMILIDTKTESDNNEQKQNRINTIKLIQESIDNYTKDKSLNIILL